MAEETKTDTVIDWIKNNKVLSILIVIGIIIIAVGNLTGSLQNIKNFFFPSEAPTPVVKVESPDEEPQRCEFDILPKDPFKYENSTKILIAAFRGKNPEDKKFGKNIALVIDEKLEEYRDDSLNLAKEDIEVKELDCYIEDHDQARKILDTLGANILVWGNSWCSTKSELAKFYPKATLTKRISPLEARGTWSQEIRQLEITELDLLSLTADEPYQLLNFIFGLHFYVRDKFEEAAVYFEKVGDEIYRNEIKDEKGVGYVYQYLAYTDQFLSRNDRGLDFYQKSLKTFVKVGDLQGQGVTLNNIGEIYDAWGKYDQAIEYYKKSLEIFESIGICTNEGVPLANIALAYYALAQYDRAIQYYERALNLAHELGLQKYDQTIQYYKRVLKITQKLGDRKGEAVILNNIGVMYAYLGMSTKAMDYYERASKIAWGQGIEWQINENIRILRKLPSPWETECCMLIPLPRREMINQFRKTQK